MGQFDGGRATPLNCGAASSCAADSAAAGKYGLVALSGGVTQTAGPITVGAGTTVTTDFVFP